MNDTNDADGVFVLKSTMKRQVLLKKPGPMAIEISGDWWASDWAVMGENSNKTERIVPRYLLDHTLICEIYLPCHGLLDD